MTFSGTSPLRPRPLRLASGGELGFERTCVMAVLNVTPDSFSDGGRYVRLEDALPRALAQVEAGAHVIDIGGESTRPGALPVPAEEQLRRIIPVIRGLRRQSDVAISVDTTCAQVAEAALGAGASLVNDISAFRFDAAMIPLLARTGAPAVAMHTLAPPKLMQENPEYADVVAEVVTHLQQRVAVCVGAGMEASQVVLDPGIGFGKNLGHNLALLRHLRELTSLGHAVLVGTSRKNFLGAVTGKPVDQRGQGSAAAAAISIVLGAHMVRVHDVAAMSDALKVAEAIASSG